MNAVPDPDLEMWGRGEGGRSSRPLDGGGGGRAPKKNFFGPLCGLKIRGKGSGPLPWILHWNGDVTASCTAHLSSRKKNRPASHPGEGESLYSSSGRVGKGCESSFFGLINCTVLSASTSILLHHIYSFVITGKIFTAQPGCESRQILSTSCSYSKKPCS